jgi:uridine kinase
VNGVPFLVGIAGGSGAGKTAVAHGLVAALGPERTALLSQDAYYRDRSHVDAAERGALDFDVPDAVDLDLLRAHLEMLRRGERVAPPRYCFVTHCRLGPGDAVEPRDVVLVEGILLLHDPGVREALDLRLFVDAPDDLRLSRRVTRDTLERGRTPESVLRQCRTSVLPAHARFVEPSRSWADLVLLNGGRLQHAVEVAAAVVRDRLGRRLRHSPGAAAA